MPCYHPIPAYRARNAGPSGKRGIVFKLKDSNGVHCEVPCGQCIGCRLERSRQWAVRLMHESQLHEDSSFITLTYAPEKLPSDGSLNKAHFQDFMKRLRFRLEPKRLRFFHCGEYGERFSRPHYHAIVFGTSFPDRCFYSCSASGERIYTSSFLADCWGHGFVSVGDVTFNSAAYVARYVVKKVTGQAAEDHYWRVDETTGEANRVAPEYVTMSLKPGIGSGWFERFGKEVFPSDEVIVNGHPAKPPRYYEKLFEVAHGDLESVKAKRLEAAERRAGDSTWRRLLVREMVKEAQLTQLKRGFESA